MAGRPRKPIDPRKVAQLAGYGCPPDEIAAELDCGETTIHRNFGTVLKRGHKRFHKRLRSILAAKAFAGDNACLIFLAKAVLGLKEHPDTVINVSATAQGGQLVISDQGKKEIENLFTSIQQRVYKRLRDPAPSGNGNGTTALN